MGLTKIMKENWLSEKLTSRLFPPSETFSVILIPPRNFYFYLIQFVMPILLAWSVRLKSYEGPLAPFRMISFYGFVQRRSVEMAQGWLYLIQIFFQWFYRSQKREKRFYLTVKIKYIDRNLLPPPPPWMKSRLFLKVTLFYPDMLRGACPFPNRPIQRIAESINSRNFQFAPLSKDTQVHYFSGEIDGNSIHQLWNELLFLKSRHRCQPYLQAFHRKRHLIR